MAHAPSPEDHRLRPLDLALILLLLVFGAWYGHAQVDLGGRPEEDAAMLLRYSKHLAEGRGIVWNMGEPPVDGATDFLFMAAVATPAPLRPVARGGGSGHRPPGPRADRRLVGACEIAPHDLKS